MRQLRMERGASRRRHWNGLPQMWTTCSSTAPRIRKTRQVLSKARRIDHCPDRSPTAVSTNPPANPFETIDAHGFSAVLRNSSFLALWAAEVVSNTALNGAFFLQIILIDELTKSSAQLAAVILSFSLPAVLLSAMAGLIVDRVPKKYILIGSNALRLVTGVALAILASSLLTSHISEALFLFEIYILVFLASAIGQFFAPAEGALIPLIVSKKNLLPANSLFTMTLTASQVLGIVILAPLGIKTIGIVGSLWSAVVLYTLATLLVAFVPRDQPAQKNHFDGLSAARRSWNEIREGWQYALGHRLIFVAVLQLSLVTMMTMTMAMLAPGYAARVLGLGAEDATVVFWPAGVGILLASILIGRFGHYIAREYLAALGIIGLALALVGLAWAGGGIGPPNVPLFRIHPELVLNTTAYVMIFALGIGLTLAMINIPAQTIVQEKAEDGVRGRVLAVQFTLSNAFAIPPLLFVGNLADRIGIPRITVYVSIFIATLAIVNLVWAVLQSRSMPRISHHTDFTA
jgi:MFS family permease